MRTNSIELIKRDWYRTVATKLVKKLEIEVVATEFKQNVFSASASVLSLFSNVYTLYTCIIFISI